MAMYQVLPSIPEALSDTETYYSYQGYETTLCHLSSYSFTESEDAGEDVEYEYELVSECEESDKEIVDSDSENESIILEIWDTEVHIDSGEEFFADESDSSTDTEIDNSTDEDEKDQWSCLTCNVKNKSFMRYCLKCWELRKDWFPDPPKRRRKRKPRPKKKNSSLNISKPSFQRCDSSASTSTTLSTLTSLSTLCSSLDSGFGSQESTNSQSITRQISSQESICAIPTDVPLTSSQESIFEPVSDRKRKVSLSEDNDFEICFTKKRRTSENEDEFDKLRSKLIKFSYTSQGKQWINSSMNDGLKDALCNISSDSEIEDGRMSGKCSLCCCRPKNASIIHGRLSHIGFCYPCAKKLFRSKQKCPICRRKIHMVTKNSYV